MKLDGKTIATLVAEGVEDLEYYVPTMRLQEEGARVLTAGLDLKPVRGKNGLIIAPDATIADALVGTPIRSLTPGDYLLGQFRHADGRKAVLINNYSITYSAWPTVEFGGPIDKVREVCPRTGKEIPVRDDSPDMPGLQLSLDAGAGRLFLIAD